MLDKWIRFHMTSLHICLNANDCIFVRIYFSWIFITLLWAPVSRYEGDWRWFQGVYVNLLVNLLWGKAFSSILQFYHFIYSLYHSNTQSRRSCRHKIIICSLINCLFYWNTHAIFLIVNVIMMIIFLPNLQTKTLSGSTHELGVIIDYFFKAISCLFLLKLWVNCYF